MPVEFLSEEQARRYGRFAADPNQEQLDRFFSFAEAEMADVDRQRADAHRLGYAVQLGTVRFLGCFTDPSEVPPVVVHHVAAALAVDPTLFKSYAVSRIRFRHAAAIRDRYGYTAFGQGPSHWQFLRWLVERVWTGDDRPTVVVDLATHWLVTRKVLLPGVTTLTRLVARARERANRRTWRMIDRQLRPGDRRRLATLLDVDDTGVSRLSRLRRGPTARTIEGLIGALDRLAEVNTVIGGRRLDLVGLPAGRLRALVDDAGTAKVNRLGERTPLRRMATLAAFAERLLAEAHDDVIDVFLVVAHDLVSRSERAVERDRGRAFAELDDAAEVLRRAVMVILDDAVFDSDVRARVFAELGADQLRHATEVVSAASDMRGPQATATHLAHRYPHVRRFLPRVLDQIRLRAAGRADHPVLVALDHLRQVEAGMARVDDAPWEVITQPWRHLAVVGDRINWRGYSLCVLDRLRLAIRARELYCPDARRWGDPRQLLLDKTTWAKTAPLLMRTLDLPARASAYLARLGAELDHAYAVAGETVTSNPDVWVEDQDGRDRVHVARLDALDEPEGTESLRTAVRALLPRVDLPELLLEVDAWCRFTDVFTHASGSRSRPYDLATSICAVLLAQACNVGYPPVTRPDHPALSPARLEWTAANFVRADTIRAANDRLIAFHQTIGLTRRWGSGELAAADGMRFVVPVRSIHAGTNPRYFGAGRGVTYYNWTSDQHTGFAAIVIPGTLRDSQFILDGLLNNTSTLEPRSVTTDTGGDSDLVHGLFRLLGYQFTPRLADLPDRRYWRLEARADYGPLNRVAVHRVNPHLVHSHWADICRVAGTLHTRRAAASELIRALQRGGRPTPLALAIGEIGRLARTVTMLDYVTDVEHRRRVLSQLNRQEGRHALARAVFHGRRGDLHQAYRSGQETQLGALGFVVNAVALWNTRYVDRAITYLGRRDPVDDAALGHLSPLSHEHINLHGRYVFAVPDEVRTGALRPLPHPLDPV